MIEVDYLKPSTIEDILGVIQRSQLDFLEYRNITDFQLRLHQKTRLQQLLINDSGFCLVAFCKNNPVGFIGITKNDFDSSFFEFDCFEFNINVFCEKDKVNETTGVLIKKAEQLCRKKSDRFYIYLSLNNNFANSQVVFNSLTEHNYYFISTLLTFSHQSSLPLQTKKSDQIIIRQAKKSDVQNISSLAERSFKFSRFHMDPFLDNQKANVLLKKSAENSILNSYVDVMFVAENKNNNDIMGYYSGKKKYYPEFEKTLGTAVISAVDQNYRGKGIFNILDSYLLNWFSEESNMAEMGTYLINYPVHKTWINKKLGLIRGSYQFSKFVSYTT